MPNRMGKIRRILILVICLGAGVWLLVGFLAEPRGRWVGLAHDRNGHFDYGQNMAVALEHGNFYRFFDELEKGRAWPPLHGLLVAVAEVLTGNDWRFAVLPGIAGWMLMLFGIFLVSEMIAAPTGLGWAAGLIALVIAALSPAHRIFATDIMLESLGAGLTVAVLACYARAAEDRTSELWWRATALTLTLLFFEKYNYWLIVALALVLAEWPRILKVCIRLARAPGWKSFLVRQSCAPLNLVLAVLLAAVVVIYVRVPGPFVWHGVKVGIYPPENILTAAFVVFFIQAAITIRHWDWKPRGVPIRMLWNWHLLPLAFSFLLPRRLSAFLAYLNPISNPGEAKPRNFPDSVAFFKGAFSLDYHVSGVMAALVLGLAGIAAWQWRKLAPGARAVLFCVLAGLVLIVAHPNQKSRFLHTWLPVVWIAAGAGGAIVLSRFAFPRVSAVVGLVALSLAGGKSWLSSGHSPETGNRALEPYSLLDSSDGWLAELKDFRRVAFVASQPCRPFVHWTFLNRFLDESRFEWPRWQEAGSGSELQSGFRDWVETTRADTLVVLEVAPGSAEYDTLFDRAALRNSLGEFLKNQTRFKMEKPLAIPATGITATLWRAK